MEAQVAKYLYELGALKRVKRSGWWLVGVRDPESVAEHSFRAAAVAYCLAIAERADPGRAVAMALLHDAHEARTCDLHQLARSYLDWPTVEDRASREQTNTISGKLAVKVGVLLGEFCRGESLEARIVRDADRLECLLQAREYEELGYPVADWIRGVVGGLTTKAGRKLGLAILKVSPGSWRREREEGIARRRRKRSEGGEGGKGTRRARRGGSRA